MDIGYGSCTALNGINHCLFLIDRKSRQKYTYGLTDLSGDTIVEAFKQFQTDIGMSPQRRITDCDNKLIKGSMAKHLRQEKIRITGAPAGRQNQNGLAERNWYTCVRMARSWLAAANLPPKFWYYAIKRAAEVSNYFPIIHNDSVTTPFEIAHQTKPDFRTLFPMFSIAYVRQLRNNSGHKENF